MNIIPYSLAYLFIFLIMSSKEQVFSLCEFQFMCLLLWSVQSVTSQDIFDDVEVPKISSYVFFWKLYGVSFCVEVQNALYINFVHGVGKGPGSLLSTLTARVLAAIVKQTFLSPPDGRGPLQALPGLSLLGHCLRPAPDCHPHCCFMVSLESKSCQSSDSALPFKDCFSYPRSRELPWNLESPCLSLQSSSSEF